MRSWDDEINNKNWAILESIYFPGTFPLYEKLEQLERLRSEIPPAAPWLPILVIQIRSQVKRRQSLSYKFKKKCQKYKFFNFARNFTHNTPSEVAW